MDEIRAERVEAVEIEALQQRQLLQQHRPLAPRTGLGQCVAAVVEGQRRFDGRLPARQVVAGQQPAMTAAGGVEHLLAPAETVDSLGDKAAIPRPAGALDLPLATAVAGLGENPAIGRGERPVAKQPSRLGRRRHWANIPRQNSAIPGETTRRPWRQSGRSGEPRGSRSRHRRSPGRGSRRWASSRNRARAASRRRTRREPRRPEARCPGSDRAPVRGTVRLSRQRAPLPGRRSRRSAGWPRSTPGSAPRRAGRSDAVRRPAG